MEKIAFEYHKIQPPGMDDLELLRWQRCGTWLSLQVSSLVKLHCAFLAELLCGSFLAVHKRSIFQK